MAVVVITSGTAYLPLASSLTTVEGWGGGHIGSTSGGAGGGGGAYAVLPNASVTVLTSVTIVIGSSAVDTNFNSSALVAKAGGVSAGGAAASCTPSTGAFSGGTGNTLTGGGGGGGAAGPDGIGLDGVAVTGNGGAGDNGSGGAGGAGSNSSNGSPGVSNVLGGGGGGRGSGGSGASGGVPGGGSGAGAAGSGAGVGGQLRITFTATVTQVVLNTGSGTQQWAPPGDCATIDRLELWGPGGSGAKETSARTTGGGAGAYNWIAGPIVVSSLLVSGTVPYLLGQGGAAVTAANTAGNSGSAKTWFSAIGTYAADFGLGGQTAGAGTAAGGVGGLVANCVPTTNGVAGGAGGTDSSTTGASGGGASPSSSGSGVNGTAVTTGIAGAGGVAPFLGGSGGVGAISTNTAVDGSIPGGGGGAKQGATGNSGAGGIGQITITYTPVVASFVATAQDITFWPSADPLPTLPFKLPPAITAVPVNPPPPSYFGRTPQTIAIAVNAWVPLSPNPSLPALEVTLIPVVARVPNATRVTSWPIIDPLPTLPRNLPPSITAVPADTPLVGGLDYNQPQYWAILTSWIPPDPAPRQKPASQIVSVDNPPFGGYAVDRPEYLAIVAGWTPPDPSPWQRYAHQIVSVDNPPIGGYTANQPEYLTTVGTWTPPDPAPWQKRPAQIASVDNPPVRSSAWTISTQVAWIPPDPTPWQKLVSQIVSVDNPPVRSGSWAISAQVGWLPPDPPAFMGDWQPLALGKVPPSIADVPANNPPFLTPPIEASIRTQWDIPPPLPTLTTKALQPFVLPPVGQPTKLWMWLSSILSGWTPPDPVPTLPRWLPAQLTAVAVNNPPFGEYLSVQTSAVTLVDWRPLDPLPTLTVKAVQPFVSPVGQPVKLWTWLSTVLSDWTPPDPVPTLPRWLPAQLTAVRVDTPIGLARWLQAVAPPVADAVPTRQRLGVPAGTVAVAQVAYAQSWLTTILAAWGPIDPAPMQRRPAPIVSADRPAPLSTGWFGTVLQEWTPSDPAPQRKQPAQFISIDRPPIAGAMWLPGVLGKWIDPDPLPKLAQKFRPFTFIPPLVDNPPLAYARGIIAVRSAIDAWQPSQPLYRYGFAFLLTPQPLGRPTPGRWTFLQPELRAVLLPLETRAVLLDPDIRAISLDSDVRGVLIESDIRAVLLQPESSGGPMDPVNIPEMFWTAAGPNDTDWYYMLLDIWLPSGDTINTPTVTITPIVGDLAPPSVSGIAVETGAVTVTIAPGVPYVSNGPRIKCKIAGGTVGNTYSTIVGWQDNQGRTLARTVLLPIEAR